METPIEHPNAARIHDHADALFQVGGNLSESIINFARMRIAGNERVMLLCGATLTLTFSGAIGLASRPAFQFTSEMTRPLLGSWRLLLFAIVCCVIANSRELVAASYHENDIIRASIEARREILGKYGVESKSNKGELPKGLASRIIEQQGKTQEEIARWFAYAARIAGLMALILLYSFAKQALQDLVSRAK